MKFAQHLLSDFLKVSLFCALMSVSLMNAQQPASSSAVPRLVNFSGKAADAQGKTITGIAGVTFAIYKDQSEGAALWLETQNVQADAKGNYTVQLGATKPDGLPLDLFSSGEARWLGVTINGGTEQPRADSSLSIFAGSFHWPRTTILVELGHQSPVNRDSSSCLVLS